MAVSTIKFSQFVTANLASSNVYAGLSGGINSTQVWPIIWTTATRPSPASGGMIGYNSDIGQMEYYDSLDSTWASLASGSLPSFPLTLADGGTGSSLFAANGGIVYSNATQLEILPPTNLAGRMLQSGDDSAPSWSIPTWPSASGASGKIIISDGTNNIYSTATFPTSLPINEILYASSVNILSGITPADNAVLVSGASGIPAWSLTLPGQVQISVDSVDNGTGANAGTFYRGDGTWGTPSGSGGVSAGTINDLAFYAATGNVVSPIATANNSGLLTNGSGIPAWATVTGTGAPVLATEPTLISPIANHLQLTSGTIVGPSGATVSSFANQSGSSVNFLLFESTDTGVSPIVAAVGSDTNITLQIQGQGTGGVIVQGVTSGSAAPSGFVRELIKSVILSASHVNFVTSSTAQTLTSISLSNGDWDIWGNIDFASTGSNTSYAAGITQVSGVFADSSLISSVSNSVSFGNGGVGLNAPQLPITITGGPVTIYLVGNATFSTGAVLMSGGIYARRR